MSLSELSEDDVLVLKCVVCFLRHGRSWFTGPMSLLMLTIGVFVVVLVFFLFFKYIQKDTRHVITVARDANPAMYGSIFLRKLSILLSMVSLVSCSEEECIIFFHVDSL